MNTKFATKQEIEKQAIEEANKRLANQYVRSVGEDYIEFSSGLRVYVTKREILYIGGL